MFQATYILFRMSLYAIFRRIRLQLAKESSILISAFIFILLIRHISNDFLQQVLGQISPAMFEKGIILWFSSVLLATCWAIKSNSSQQKLYEFAKFYGASTDNLRLFGILEKWVFPFVILLFFLLALTSYVPISLTTGSIFCLGLIILFLPSSTHLIKGFPFKPGYNSILTLTRWRFSQIIRNEYPQFFIITITLAMPLILQYYNKLFQQALILWVLSFAYALIIAKGISQSLKSSQIEKICGVSHLQWMKSCELATLAICIIPFSIAFLSTSNFQLACITLAIPWLVPWIILQLDGRRPGLVVPSLWLLSLLWVTALLVHPASVFIALPIRAYGYQSQQDRFYGS